MSGSDNELISCPLKTRTDGAQIRSISLLGIRSKCAKGHEWESAVGGVWLQMPTCPECKPEMTVPAVAWIGRWEHMPNMIDDDGCLHSEKAQHPGSRAAKGNR
jgi:hypothetical protein